MPETITPAYLREWCTYQDDNALSLGSVGQLRAEVRRIIREFNPRDWPTSTDINTWSRVKLTKLLKGEPVPVDKPKREVASANASAIDAQIAMLEGLANGLCSTPIFAKAIRRELAKIVTKEIVVKRYEAPAVNVGIQHKHFPRLLELLSSGQNVYLYGPAGTGKTTAAMNAAKALGVPFFMNGRVDSEYKVLGYCDAAGNYHSTELRRAYDQPSVYLFDELDASDPRATTALNAALENGICDFAGTQVKRHPEARICAAANTVYGATSRYVGRTKLDEAFKDRFALLEWPIDESLERAIAMDDEWVDYVHAARRNADKAGVDATITPRASYRGAAIIRHNPDNPETRQLAIDSCVRRGLSDDAWAKVDPKKVGA